MQSNLNCLILLNLNDSLLYSNYLLQHYSIRKMETFLKRKTQSLNIKNTEIIHTKFSSYEQYCYIFAIYIPTLIIEIPGPASAVARLVSYPPPSSRSWQAMVTLGTVARHYCPTCTESFPLSVTKPCESDILSQSRALSLRLTKFEIFDFFLVCCSLGSQGGLVAAKCHIL